MATALRGLSQYDLQRNLHEKSTAYAPFISPRDHVFSQSILVCETLVLRPNRYHLAAPLAWCRPGSRTGDFPTSVSGVGQKCFMPVVGRYLSPHTPTS